MRGKKRIGLLFLLIAVVVGGGGLLLAQKALHKTSDTAFCLSCHSMSKPFEEYQGTVHFSNQKGIRAERKGYVRNVQIAIFQSQGWIIYLLN